MRVYIVVAKVSENEMDDQPGVNRAVYIDPAEAANAALKMHRAERTTAFEVQPWEVRNGK